MGKGSKGAFVTGMRQKILMTNFHPCIGGGHDTFIISLVTSELRNGFEFAVAVPKTSRMYKVLKERGVTVFACDFPSNIKEIWPILLAVHRFRRIRENFRPRLIHTNGGADNSIVVWSSLLGRKRFAVVRTHHAVRRIPTDPYHVWLYNRAVDFNTYVSLPAKKISQSGDALRLKRSAVIENGIDTDFYKPMPKNYALMKHLGIAKESFIFGSTAGLGHYKRVDVMLNAAASLKDSFDFKVLLLGDEENARGLMKRAEDMGLKDIVLYGGFHEDVRSYCSLFDAGFVLSDSIETISYGAREMLAMGIPLILSDYSGLKENIDPGVNGYLVRPGNVGDVVDTMKKFLSLSEDQLLDLRNNARRKAETSFSIKRQVSGFRALYGELLTGAG
jgi:L-malate glycosyltransferase